MSSDNLHNEKELFTLISEGDETAFHELFKQTSPILQSIIYKVTDEPDAVPDLLQEIFLRVWVNRDKLAEVKEPRSWLIKVTYRYTFNWIREKRTRQRIYGLLPDQPQYVEPDHSSFSEMKKHIANAINALPPQAKVVYTLSRKGGLSIGEIATRLQLSPQTVKNYLGRAIQSIRVYLEKQEIFLPLLVFLVII